MKKVLAVVLTAGLVLSLGTMAFGAVNVSGEMKYKYTDTFEDSSNANDKLEGKIILESQIDQQLSAKFIAKTEKSDYVTDFYADEYFINYAPSFGNLKAGLWGYKTKGKIDVIDAAFKDLKSEVAFEFSTKVADLLDVSVWVSPDASGKKQKVALNAANKEEITFTGAYDEVVEDFAHVVKVGINKDNWGVEGNYVDTKVTDDTGYTVNGYFVPVENLTLYGQYGVDQAKDETQIVGVSYKAGNLLARFEYDIEKYSSDPDAKAEWDSNPMGLKLVYAGPHGVEYEAGYKTSQVKGADEKKEAWASAKFFLK